MLCSKTGCCVRQASKLFSRSCFTQCLDPVYPYEDLVLNFVGVESLGFWQALQSRFLSNQAARIIHKSVASPLTHNVRSIPTDSIPTRLLPLYPALILSQLTVSLPPPPPRSPQVWCRASSLACAACVTVSARPCTASSSTCSHVDLEDEGKLQAGGEVRPANATGQHPGMPEVSNSTSVLMSTPLSSCLI